jgi:hypothetical protein
MKRIAQYKVDPAGTLAMCGVPLGTDFCTLRSEQVFKLLEWADQGGYRKPANANGSRGRYFHDLLQRRARKCSR